MTNGQRGMRQVIQRKRSETEHFRAVLNYCQPQVWSRTESLVQRQKKPRSVFFEQFDRLVDRHKLACMIVATTGPQENCAHEDSEGAKLRLQCQSSFWLWNVRLMVGNICTDQVLSWLRFCFSAGRRFEKRRVGMPWALDNFGHVRLLDHLRQPPLPTTSWTSQRFNVDR